MNIHYLETMQTRSTVDPSLASAPVLSIKPAVVTHPFTLAFDSSFTSTTSSATSTSVVHYCHRCSMGSAIATFSAFVPFTPSVQGWTTIAVASFAAKIFVAFGVPSLLTTEGSYLPTMASWSFGLAFPQLAIGASWHPLASLRQLRLGHSLFSGCGWWCIAGLPPKIRFVVLWLARGALWRYQLND